MGNWGDLVKMIEDMGRIKSGEFSDKENNTI